MVGRRALLAVLGARALPLGAQEAGVRAAAAPAEPPVEFTCPMDKDVKQSGPGKCPRCGMKLSAHLPDYVEYGIDIRTSPRLIQAGKETLIEFRILDPKTRKPVSDFEIVHTKIFHLFIVSSDLKYFAHEHPVYVRDGLFQFRTTLPFPGAYRIVADVYPAGGTPQFLIRTLLTAGVPDTALSEAARLAPTPRLQKGENLEVELTIQPEQAIAGLESLLFFKLRPREGLEQYLAAWGHMLISSDDQVDIIHDHPLYAYPGEPVRPQVQFNILFPRARTYRVWVQFQRLGVVNTFAFNVPVKELG